MRWVRWKLKGPRGCSRWCCSSIKFITEGVFQILPWAANTFGVTLVRGFLTHEDVAGVCCSGWINRYISFIDVLNDPVLIYYKSSSISEPLFFVEDAVLFHHGSFEIAEEWKCDADVLSKTAVGGNTVDADSKNLSVGSFELGDISLI